MSIPLTLDNKVALITGGSRGIGAATVRMFVAAGARVVFNYQRAKDQAEQLAKECGASNCFAVASDLSSIESARSWSMPAVHQFGRLDILVANHGVWPPDDAPVERMSDEQWHSTVSINLDSVFGLVKHSVPQMKSQPRAGKAAGNIVLVSSTAGQRGEAFHCDYAATKGALISMVKGLSTELAASAIYVNCIAPGWVNTDMSAPALNDPKTRDGIFNKIPLGRVGTPDEIAGPILFLCTDYAGFITGEVFNVNGGAVLVAKRGSDRGSEFDTGGASQGRAPFLAYFARGGRDATALNHLAQFSFRSTPQAARISYYASNQKTLCAVFLCHPADYRCSEPDAPPAPTAAKTQLNKKIVPKPSKSSTRRSRLSAVTYLSAQDVTQDGRFYSFFHGESNSVGIPFGLVTKYPDKDRFEVIKMRQLPHPVLDRWATCRRKTRPTSF